MTIAHWLIGFIVSVLVANFPSTARAQQTVDIIITNGHILTMDDQLTEYERGFVAINDNKIVALGPQTKAAAFQAKKVMDVDGDIVLPGFINTHTHASMSLFRSLGDDVADRLHSYIFPLVALDFVCLRLCLFSRLPWGCQPPFLGFDALRFPSLVCLRNRLLLVGYIPV